MSEDSLEQPHALRAVETYTTGSFAAPPGSADTIIRNLLKSSDCSWYERNEGHDWREAVGAAERYLKACPPNSDYPTG